MTQAPYLADRGRLLARVLTLTTLVAAAAAIGFGGCTLSRDGTREQQCTTVAECPEPSNDCVIAACGAEGACEEVYNPDEDDPSVVRQPPQTPGDCMLRRCEMDGASAILIEEPADDAPADVLCVTDYECVDGELVTTAVELGDSCVDGNSTGVCALDNNNQPFCRFNCGPNIDCPASDNPCLEYVCNTVTWECDPDYLDNVPSPGDTDGDCGVAYCVAGVEEVTIDNSDLPPDEICSQGICNNGVPEQDPRDPGFGCAGGGELEVCDGAGNCVECVDIGTCEQLPDPTDCSYRECIANQCVYTHQPNGHVIASQNVGDCKDVVCDGNGNTQQVNNDGDTPDDLNPCTSNVCTNGTPSNPGCCAGGNCGSNGVCGSGGQLGSCVGCNQPSDCGADNPPCMARTCVANVCGQSFAPSGTLVTNNPVGDCKRQVCDGAGNTVFANSNDPPTHPNECRYYTCSNGSPVENNDPPGTDCTNDSIFCDGDEVCNAGGNCANPATGPCPGHNVGPNCNDSCNENLDNCTANDSPTTTCGSPSNTACDNPDTCSGGSCQPNNEPNGTSCNDGTFCNGSDSCQSGVCTPSGTNPCPGHNTGPVCNDSCNEGTDQCNGFDASGTPCTGGSCNTTGVCKLTNGQTCSLPADCASNFCADTVCCNNACDGTCEACDNSGSVGTCSDYAAGTDPDAECVSPTDSGPSCSSGACACDVDPSSYSSATFNNPSSNVNCPAGQNCSVTCANNSCDDITVTCPADGTCTVSCSDSGSNGACGNLVVNCGAEGICSLTCTNNTCSGATINCGQDRCLASCGNTAATMNANDACITSNSSCNCSGC